MGEAARALKDAATAGDVEDDARGPRARRQAQLEEARAVVRTAEQRLARQADVEADIAARKTELESATSAEEAVAAALLQAEAEANAVAEAEHLAAAERSRAEAELAAAVDAEHRASDALAQLTNRLAAASEAPTRRSSSGPWRAQAAVDHAAAALEGARRELSLIDAQWLISTAARRTRSWPRRAVRASRRSSGTCCRGWRRNERSRMRARCRSYSTTRSPISGAPTSFTCCRGWSG